MKSWLMWLAVAVMIPGIGCSDDADVGETPGATISVSGIAYSFTLPGQDYGRIDGARVSVLEIPDRSATADSEGAFTLEDLPVGAEATFVLEDDDHPLTYTKTFTLPDHDIDDLTFQIPNNGLFTLIETGLAIQTDPGKCQIVSTFTRIGKSISDSGPHGEPGAILTIEPSGTAEEGPIYFNDDVLPDRSRTYSSLDGGVLLINVDPGDYILAASCVDDPTDMIVEYPADDYPDESLRCATEEVVFEQLLMKCRPGVFLNASPSYGLQVQEDS